MDTGLISVKLYQSEKIRTTEKRGPISGFSSRIRSPRSERTQFTTVVPGPYPVIATATSSHFSFDGSIFCAWARYSTTGWEKQRRANGVAVRSIRTATTTSRCRELPSTFATAERRPTSGYSAGGAESNTSTPPRRNLIRSKSTRSARINRFLDSSYPRYPVSVSRRSRSRPSVVTVFASNSGNPILRAGSMTERDGRPRVRSTVEGESDWRHRRRDDNIAGKELHVPDYRLTPS